MSSPSQSSIVPQEAGQVTPPGKDNHSPPSSPRTETKIRGRWTHNPVVLAALSCANMSSCEDVKTIFKECQETKSDSMMCEAAEKYYKMCHMNGNSAKDILDYNPYQE